MIQILEVLPTANGWETGWDAIAAIATFLAVIASLVIALHANSVRKGDEKKQAHALADALCDELRAIHWRLEKIEALPRDGNVARAWKAYQRHKSALVTPVLDRCNGRIHVYDGNTAALITSAYGNVLRVRALMKRQPQIPYDSQKTEFYSEIIKGLTTTIPPVRERVRAAILATWKYTPHPKRDPFERASGEA